MDDPGSRNPGAFFFLIVLSSDDFIMRTCSRLFCRTNSSYMTHFCGRFVYVYFSDAWRNSSIVIFPPKALSISLGGAMGISDG